MLKISHLNIASTPVNNYKTRITHQKESSMNSISFSGLLQDAKKDAIKMCVYDLDESLLEGPQVIRDKVMEFSKDKNRHLVYASARSVKQVVPLIEKGVLAMPDYYIGDNGLTIYKKVGNELKEIEIWSNKLVQGFHKDKIRKFMIDIANEYNFENPNHVKESGAYVPVGKEAYAGSKISEYEVFHSPLNIYFMMAPGIFDKTKARIESKLQSEGVEANVKFQNFAKKTLEPDTLAKYFSPKIASDMLNTAIPRLNDDGSIDVAIITAKSDKGTAVEFIRKQLNINPNEIFAAGDAENDYSNTNKGYFFALLANATEGFKKLVSRLLDKQQIIKTTKKGVEGIWECLEP